MILYFKMCTGFTAGPSIKWDIYALCKVAPDGTHMDTGCRLWLFSGARLHVCGFARPKFCMCFSRIFFCLGPVIDPLWRCSPRLCTWRPCSAGMRINREGRINREDQQNLFFK